MEAFRHDRGLVRDLGHVDAEGKVGADLIDRLVQRVTQRHDIGAIGHRDADTHGRPAFVKGEVGRRIFVSTPDGGNVAEPECLPAHLHRQVTKCRHAVECAAYADRDLVGAGLDRPRSGHGVLVADRVEDRLGRDAQGGKTRLADLDVDPFFHIADQRDLRHIPHPQKARAQSFCIAVQVGKRGAVPRQHVDRREDIAIFVVEERAEHALRQVGPCVAHLLADLVPDVGHFRPAVAILQLNGQNGRAGA